jgi:hypothetical protein
MAGVLANLAVITETWVRFAAKSDPHSRYLVFIYFDQYSVDIHLN